jgi:hypothetical protein
VRLYVRIAVLLGTFLLAAGLIYGGTNKERMGLVLMLVAGTGFAYVGLSTRRVVRVADAADAADAAARDAAEAGPETQAEAGSGVVDPGKPSGGHPVEEVRPTIWPLVFSLAGAGLVAGVLASHWIILVGGVLAVAAAVGWFREVLTQGQKHH